MSFKPVREWSLFMVGEAMEKGGDIEFECKQLEGEQNFNAQVRRRVER